MDACIIISLLQISAQCRCDAARAEHKSITNETCCAETIEWTINYDMFVIRMARNKHAFESPTRAALAVMKDATDGKKITAGTRLFQMH